MAVLGEPPYHASYTSTHTHTYVMQMSMCTYKIVFSLIPSVELEVYLHLLEGNSLDSANGVEFYYFCPSK